MKKADKSKTMTWNTLPEKPVKPHSITKRLVFSLVVTVTVVSIITIAPLYFFVVSDQRKEILEKVEEYSDHLVGILELPLWNQDDSTIRAIGTTFFQNELVVNLKIINEFGETYFNMEKEHGVDLLHHSSKIFHRGEYLGEINFSLTKRYSQAVGRTLLSIHSTAVLFILATLLVVGGVLIRRYLRKPLQELDDIVRSYRLGEYTGMAAELPYKEFRPFGKVLAGMGAEIQEQLRELHQAEETLTRHRDDLEELVKMRTAELSVAKEQADLANEAKSDFLARMSHEIRTPLNAVTGLTGVVLKSQLTPKQRDHLNKVQIASSNLLEVINDILDFSKVEAGQLELNPAPFDLDQLMEHLVDLFSNRLGQKDLELIISIPTEVPRQLIGDATRLTQVLTNLLDNAIKFADRGEIIITVATDDQVDCREGLTAFKLQVSDNGTGIPAKELTSLFDPFTQADSSLTREHEGTGLGLAICRRLVELMGGSISAASVLGEGSIFTFTVLLEIQQEQKSRLSIPAGLYGLKILVVDDSAHARQALVDALAGFNFEVSAKERGEQALTELRRSAAAGAPYKLVMMDWKMPGIDGIEAGTAIHNTKEIPPPAIVLMATPYGHEQVQDRIDSNVVDHLVIKPIKLLVLFNTIMQLFDRYEALVPSADMERVPLEHLTGRRILVVEDSELNLDVAVSILEEGGMLVDTAVNGSIAVDMVKEAAVGYFDAVLMDIQMPVLDGYEASQRIRRLSSANSEVPIIALTAHALKGEQEKCIAAGMVDFISKPIDERQLWEVLLKWLPRQPKEVSIIGAPQEKGQRVDFAAALERLRGRRALLVRMLSHFEPECSRAVDAIRGFLDSGDRQEAERLAHTVKGTALQIGATRLAEVSADLEKSISHNHEAVESNLLIFEKELNLSIIAVSEFLEQEVASGPIESGQDQVERLPAAKIEETLQQLVVFLESGDMRAVDIWSSVKLSLQGKGRDPQVGEIDSMVNRIDFTGALILVEELKQWLNRKA